MEIRTRNISYPRPSCQASRPKPLDLHPNCEKWEANFSHQCQYKLKHEALKNKEPHHQDFLDHDLFSQLHTNCMRISLKKLNVDIKAQSPVFPFNKYSFKNTEKRNSSLFFTWISLPQKSKLAVRVLSGSVWVTQHYNLKLSFAWQKQIVLQDFSSDYCKVGKTEAGNKSQ